jgi:hypothetical protein
VIGTEAPGTGRSRSQVRPRRLPAGAGRKVQYTVSVSRDSAVWKTVCPVYPNQRLTLIGQDEPAPPTRARLALRRRGRGPPDQRRARRAARSAGAPKDAFECSFDAAGGYYTIRSRRGGRRCGRRAAAPAAESHAGAGGASRPKPGPADRRRAASVAGARPAAVWTLRAAPLDAAPDRRSRMTALPLARPAPAQGAMRKATRPMRRWRASGRAGGAGPAAPVALPRDRRPGAGDRPEPRPAPAAPGADAVLGFAVDAGDTLHASPPPDANASPRRPASARFDGAQGRLLAPAPEMADRYLRPAAPAAAAGAAGGAGRALRVRPRRADAGRAARARFAALPARRRGDAAIQRRPPRPVAQRLQLRGRAGRLPHRARQRRPRPCTTSTNSCASWRRSARRRRNSPTGCRPATTWSPATTCCASTPERAAAWPGWPTCGAGADPGAGRLPDAAPLVAPPEPARAGRTGRHAGAGQPVRRWTAGAPAPAAAPLAGPPVPQQRRPAAGARYRVDRRPEPALGTPAPARRACGAAGRHLVSPPARSTATGGRYARTRRGEAVEGWASSLWLRRADERAITELGASGCNARCRPASARSRTKPSAA